MPRSIPFQILNVFAEELFGGNPLAVIEDASALKEDELMPLCRQFNLSETTFVFPPLAGGAARVRIFSPDGEMPFAGHPTLGTSHVVRALLGAGDAFSLELAVGPIPVTAEGDFWELRANPGTSRETPANEALAKMLGVSVDALLAGARWMNSGSEQMIVPFADLASLRAVRPELNALAQHGKNAEGRVGVSCVFIEGQRVTSRFFWMQGDELREDPGTGSACANLGAWLQERGARGPAVWNVAQGHQTGRINHLRLRLDQHGRVHVGGRVIALMRGTIELS